MTSPLGFQLLATDGTARAGLLQTRRGPVETPVFMPVATHAGFRLHTVDEAQAIGANLILSNTYHLMLRPGREVFEKLGGIHRFMNWSGSVLTDSGGYQIFSIPNDRQMSEKGAVFTNPHDSHRHMLSPETSIQMQQAIGSEIMMVLDVCINATSSEEPTRLAMEQTHRWALRSLAEHQSRETGQALFAIVQGGSFEQLRTQSAQYLTQHPFDGFAIGGLAVGESREVLYAMTGHTTQFLPVERPRYLMGVGTPIDLLESVKRGIDMFDCIIPTKMAQQGFAYTFQGKLRMSRREYRLSDQPIDAECDCSTCTRFSRGYVQHQISGHHHLGVRLIGIHNLRHYQLLMGRMRKAILENRFDEEYMQLKRVLAKAKET